MNIQSNPSGERFNRSMPPGTIIPELVYSELGEAVAWLCEIFGFTERLRIGNHRCQLVFGNASVIAVAKGSGQASTSPDSAGLPRENEVTHSVMVRVNDVDRHYKHVKQCGVRINNPPANYPYGERQYTVEDIAGHRWTFSQSIADVDPSEWGGILPENPESSV